MGWTRYSKVIICGSCGVSSVDRYYCMNIIIFYLSASNHIIQGPSRPRSSKNPILIQNPTEARMSSSPKAFN